MNATISEIFGVLLNLFHILILAALVLFALFGEPLIYDSLVRIVAVIFGFILYAIIFGAISTLIVMKEELVSINEQLVESNTKMALFFGYIEEEINKKAASKR